MVLLVAVPSKILGVAVVVGVVVGGGGGGGVVGVVPTGSLFIRVG